MINVKVLRKNKYILTVWLMWIFIQLGEERNTPMYWIHYGPGIMCLTGWYSVSVKLHEVGVIFSILLMINLNIKKGEELHEEYRWNKIDHKMIIVKVGWSCTTLFYFLKFIWNFPKLEVLK